MKYLLSIFSSVLFLCGCANSSQETSGSDIAYITGYDQDIRPNAEGLNVEIAKTIKLETTEDNLLQALTKVNVINDSIIVVSDQNSVQGYSMSGKHLCNFGSKGNGAGDYIALSGFFVNTNSEVVIIDNYRCALLRYKSDGSFIGKIDIDRSVLQTVRDGLAINNDTLFFNEYICDKDNPLYITYNTNNQKVISDIQQSVRSEGVRYSVGTNPMSLYDNNVLALKTFSPYIYDWRGKPVYKFETKRNIFDTEITPITNYSFSTFAEAYAQGFFIGFTDIYETSDYLICMCSNLEYVVVDKKTLICKRFEYTSNRIQVKEDINPIVNVVGVHNDYLIGNLFSQSIMVKNETTDQLMKKWNCLTNPDDNPVLIFYDIK